MTPPYFPGTRDMTPVFRQLATRFTTRTTTSLRWWLGFDI